MDEKTVREAEITKTASVLGDWRGRGEGDCASMLIAAAMRLERPAACHPQIWLRTVYTARGYVAVNQYAARVAGGTANLGDRRRAKRANTLLRRMDRELSRLMASETA